MLFNTNDDLKWSTQAWCIHTNSRTHHCYKAFSGCYSTYAFTTAINCVFVKYATKHLLSSAFSSVTQRNVHTRCTVGKNDHWHLGDAILANTTFFISAETAELTRHHVSAYFFKPPSTDLLVCRRNGSDLPQKISNSSSRSLKHFVFSNTQKWKAWGKPESDVSWASVQKENAKYASRINVCLTVSPHYLAKLQPRINSTFLENHHSAFGRTV